jgi:hypothetical protein
MKKAFIKKIIQEPSFHHVNKINIASIAVFNKYYLSLIDSPVVNTGLSLNQIFLFDISYRQQMIRSKNDYYYDYRH